MTRPVQTSAELALEKRIVTLWGEVQGLGIRPTVARLASSLGLRGSVRNGREGVVIELIGDPTTVESFLAALPQAVPATFESDVSKPGKPELLPDGFTIDRSLERGAIRTRVPLDRNVCEACLLEMSAPSNRRYGYPFISCTRCGPRYSILKEIPYDRQRTSMAPFSMCERCLAEYEDPTDRRFHSQTNCCPDCGPRWWSVEPSSGRTLERSDALTRTAEILCEGGIVALKGLGGYQLVCDVTHPEAMERLRTSKQRPRKPMAVMVGTLELANQLASLSPPEVQSMLSPAGPIVLARARTDSPFSESFARYVHPGLRDVGLMLPTTPLHDWLCRRIGRPLIVTSGNREGEPLVYRESEAAVRLNSMADLLLHHDREIIRPIDDSVVRCLAGRMVTLRAGRGLAPMELGYRPSPQGSESLGKSEPIWATGGEQKVAVAIWNGQQAVLGPHLGEMQHPAARDRFLEQSQALMQLYGCRPTVTSHDLHPDYFSTRHAQDWAPSDDIASGQSSQSHRPDRAALSMAVQHHHAHVVSGMIEQGWLEQEVLGIAMDGTGFGSDGTIWGGEILVASSTRFERVAHLRPFRLPGGEAAIREPYRSAIAVTADAIEWELGEAVHPFPLDFPQTNQILQVVSHPQWSPKTTSLGRLFDAVAAIALDEGFSSFEGELAMRLEAICDPEDQVEYTIAVGTDRPLQLDWRPMIRQLLDDRRDRVPPAALAMRFHRGLARSILAVVERFPDLPVVLSGGAFQNRVLVELIIDRFPADRKLGLSSQIPPNDGGLAAGQLAATLSLPSRRPSCV